MADNATADALARPRKPKQPTKGASARAWELYKHAIEPPAQAGGAGRKPWRVSTFFRAFFRGNLGGIRGNGAFLLSRRVKA